MSAEQVAMAVEAIGRVRALSPSPIVVVDPILGDTPKGLYVKPEVAEAVAGRLAPIADWITPNAWEMSHLSGVEVTDGPRALAAARAFGRPALVSSVPAGDEIGVALSDPARLISHPRFEAVPNGTGDLLTAVFGAALCLGATAEAAAEQAVRATVEAVGAARALGASELPLAALGERLAQPSAALRIAALS
jgi:pyridoxine kinase